MSKEIKFRAWDEQTQRMLDHNYLLNYSFKNVMKAYGESGRLMQFTGLRDSKRTEEYPEGQEIYDGDILMAWKHGETSFIHEVKHRSGILWFGNWNWIEFQNVFRNLEVIGNIYENPELMEDK